MDWWANTPVFMGPQSQDKLSESESPANPELEALQARVKELEATLAESPGAPAPEEPRFRRREESA